MAKPAAIPTPLDPSTVSEYKVTATPALFGAKGSIIENTALRLRFEAPGQRRTPDGLVNTPGIVTLPLNTTHANALSLERDGFVVEPSPQVAEIARLKAAEVKGASDRAAVTEAKRLAELEHTRKLDEANAALSNGKAGKPTSPTVTP